MPHYLNLRRILSVGISIAFLANTVVAVPTAQAQDFALPKPGTMVSLSPVFAPPVLKGIQLDSKNPFRFHFFVDKGEASLNQEKLKQESSKLIKYFLASLTIPEKDLWVNLSPYEKDRIVPDAFGQTAMGRDLLAQDYMLKQVTASLIYPESQLGKEFWSKVYAKAKAKYGITQIPINTFNKVWIVPEKAVVYENGGVAFVLENHLKVMLEQDYLANEKNKRQLVRQAHHLTRDMFQSEQQNVSPRMLLSEKPKNVKTSQGNPGSRDQSSDITNQIIRDIVIPALTREVNEGKNFAQLRQVFYSLILATWYKKKIKDSILNKVLSNQNKIHGVNVSAGDKDKIYQDYLQAFKKGAYNYIKEEPSGIPGQNIARKYFSGGMVGRYDLSNTRFVGPQNVNPAQIADMAQTALRLEEITGFAEPISVDRAMKTSPEKSIEQRVADDAQKILNYQHRNINKYLPFLGQTEGLSKEIAHAIVQMMSSMIMIRDMILLEKGDLNEDKIRRIKENLDELSAVLNVLIDNDRINLLKGLGDKYINTKNDGLQVKEYLQTYSWPEGLTEKLKKFQTYYEKKKLIILNYLDQFQTLKPDSNKVQVSSEVEANKSGEKKDVADEAMTVPELIGTGASTDNRTQRIMVYRGGETVELNRFDEMKIQLKPDIDMNDVLTPDQQASIKREVKERDTKKEPLGVAIVIPTSSSADYIEGTLTSILKDANKAKELNPYWKIEIIVALNGTNQHSTLEVLRRYLSVHQHDGVSLTVIHLENIGTKVAAMNQAVEYAKSRGHYFTGFMDDDVRINPGSLNKIIRSLIDQEGVYFAGSRYQWVDMPQEQRSFALSIQNAYSKGIKSRYLPQGAGMFLFTAAYPGIPKSVISDDGYMLHYFWGKDQNPRQRIWLPSQIDQDAVILFKPTTDLEGYRKRRFRVAMGRAQREYLFPNKSKVLSAYCEMETVKNNPPPSIGSINAEVDQKVKLVESIARAASTWLDGFSAFSIQSKDWGSDISTKKIPLEGVKAQESENNAMNVVESSIKRELGEVLVDTIKDFFSEGFSVSIINSSGTNSGGLIKLENKSPGAFKSRNSQGSFKLIEQTDGWAQFGMIHPNISNQYARRKFGTAFLITAFLLKYGEKGKNITAISPSRGLIIISDNFKALDIGNKFHIAFSSTERAPNLLEYTFKANVPPISAETLAWLRAQNERNSILNEIPRPGILTGNGDEAMNTSPVPMKYKEALSKMQEAVALKLDRLKIVIAFNKKGEVLFDSNFNSKTKALWKNKSQFPFSHKELLEGTPFEITKGMTTDWVNVDFMIPNGKSIDKISITLSSENPKGSFTDAILSFWGIRRESLPFDGYNDPELKKFIQTQMILTAKLIYTACQKAGIQNLEEIEVLAEESLVGDYLIKLIDFKNMPLPLDEFNKAFPDAAMNTGGIDFNPAQMSMQLKKQGEDFKFDFNGVNIDAAQVIGATFTIETMTPVNNLPSILGLTASTVPQR